MKKEQELRELKQNLEAHRPVLSAAVYKEKLKEIEQLRASSPKIGAHL